jgi:hypothetical protein
MLYFHKITVNFIKIEIHNINYSTSETPSKSSLPDTAKVNTMAPGLWEKKKEFCCCCFSIEDYPLRRQIKNSNLSS